MSDLGLGAPVQVAYVVADLDAAVEEWSARFGAGPFEVRRHVELRDVELHGRPATFDHSSAYGQWGDVMVELVQDHGTGPSVVRDRFAPGEGGLHHLAFLVDDLAATLARLSDAGLETVMRATTAGGTTFCFVDAVATHGHHLELYERTDRMVAFYRSIADLARR